jgi:hypothetical protein
MSGGVVGEASNSTGGCLGGARVGKEGGRDSRKEKPTAINGAILESFERPRCVLSKNHSHHVTVLKALDIGP